MKDHLRDPLQGHVAPMLQPEKSTADLIHEKQTERANEESARVINQNKYDLLMTNVQKISQEIDGHVQPVESLVTGLPQDLLLLVLSRGQEVMNEREKVQKCHNIDELLKGGLDG